MSPCDVCTRWRRLSWCTSINESQLFNINDIMTNAPSKMHYADRSSLRARISVQCLAPALAYAKIGSCYRSDTTNLLLISSCTYGQSFVRCGRYMHANFQRKETKKNNSKQMYSLTRSKHKLFLHSFRFAFVCACVCVCRVCHGRSEAIISSLLHPVATYERTPNANATKRKWTHSHDPRDNDGN